MELFFHKEPEGYEYYIDSFNASTKRIWIINNTREFVYKEGKGQPRSVWGFYKPKSGKYYAPINHKKVGKEVDIHDTTPFSAMQLTYNPLEMALYGNS